MNVLILIFKDIHHGTGSVKTCSSRWIMIQIKTILPKILTPPIDAIVLSRRRAVRPIISLIVGGEEQQVAAMRNAAITVRRASSAGKKSVGPVCRTWARCLPPHNHLLSHVPLSPALLPLSRISDEKCNAP